MLLTRPDLSESKQALFLLGRHDSWMTGVSHQGMERGRCQGSSKGQDEVLGVVLGVGVVT